MSFKWRWLAGLLVAGAIAGGCSSDDEVASNEDRPVVAADNTNVVTAVDDVIVEADRLRFPKATHSEILGRVKGDLLVGDRASPGSTVNQNPDGFLRTVEAVTVVGDEIIVETSPAYVTDMITEGRQSTELKPPTPTAPASHAMAVKATALPTIDFAGLKFGPLEVKSPDIKINLKGVPLTGKFYAKATVDIGKGKLSFKPDTGLVFDIKNGKLEEFQAYLQGQWDAEVSSQFQFETGFSAGVDWKTALGEATAAEKKAFADQLTAFASGGPIPEFNAKVASHSINLPTWWVPTPIGPIPVVSTLNFDLGLSCGVKFKGTVTAKAGTKASATLKIGAKYVNKNGQEGWSPIADKNWDIQPDQVSVTGALDAEASCKLKPTFSLIFYGVAGPYIYVSASATAKASAAQSCDGTSEIPKVDVNLKLSQNYAMGVGAKLGLFIPPLKIDYTLAEADVKLFNLDWVIGDFDVYSGYPDLGFGFCSATGTGGSGGSGGGTGGSGGNSGGGGSGGSGGGTGGSGGTGGGTSSPCAGKSTGWYCGASSQFSYGNANTRYLCSGGALASSEVCASGCQVNPPGSDDVCSTTSPCAGKSTGWYCGASSQFSYGNANTRYLCSGGALASSEFCPAGCQVAPPGYDDTCL